MPYLSYVKSQRHSDVQVKKDSCKGVIALIIVQEADASTLGAKRKVSKRQPSFFILPDFPSYIPVLNLSLHAAMAYCDYACRISTVTETSCFGKLAPVNTACQYSHFEQALVRYSY